MNAAPPPRPIVPFHEHTKLEFLDAPTGEGWIKAPADRALTNHLGTVHGGMLFAIGEIAAANGIVRMLGADIQKLRAITRRGAIEYLKPARGAIDGRAKVSMTAAEIFAALKGAPSIDVPIDVVLTDEAGVEVAKLSIVWFVGRPKTSTRGDAASG